MDIKAKKVKTPGRMRRTNGIEHDRLSKIKSRIRIRNAMMITGILLMILSMEAPACLTHAPLRVFIFLALVLASYFTITHYGSRWDALEALLDNTKSILDNPNDANAYFYRAEAYAKLDEIDHSLDDYQIAFELDPNPIYQKSLAKAYSNRSNLHWKEMKPASAISDISRACELSIKNDWYSIYLVDRGEMYLEIGAYKEAIHDFKEVLAVEEKTSFITSRAEKHLEYAEKAIEEAGFK